MTVACMFPIALLFAVLPQAIFGLVLTTSVEQMKRKGVIAEVRREMNTKKAIQAMKLLRMMKASAKSRNTGGKDEDAQKVIAEMPATKKERMEQQVCAAASRLKSV